jgi:hypothetical protein
VDATLSAERRRGDRPARSQAWSAAENLLRDTLRRGFTLQYASPGGGCRTALRRTFPRDEFSVDPALLHASSRRALALHSSLAGGALLGRQRVASDQRVLLVLGLNIVERAASRLFEGGAGFP